jgi:hypothetical protein
MRTLLKTRVGLRKIFTGVFVRYGFVRDPEGIVKSTAVLSNIKVKGIVVADHAWMEVTNDFREVGVLSKGDKIMFTARIKPYYKSGSQKDVGLVVPTKVRKCTFNDPE